MHTFIHLFNNHLLSLKHEPGAKYVSFRDTHTDQAVSSQNEVNGQRIAWKHKYFAPFKGLK